MENSVKTSLSNISKYKCVKISNAIRNRKISYLNYKSRKARTTAISFKTMMYRKKSNNNIQFMKNDKDSKFQYSMNIMISEFNIDTRIDLRYAAYLGRRRESILSNFRKW